MSARALDLRRSAVGQVRRYGRRIQLLANLAAGGGGGAYVSRLKPNIRISICISQSLIYQSQSLISRSNLQSCRSLTHTSLNSRHYGHDRNSDMIRAGFGRCREARVSAGAITHVNELLDYYSTPDDVASHIGQAVMRQSRRGCAASRFRCAIMTRDRERLFRMCTRRPMQERWRCSGTSISRRRTARSRMPLAAWLPRRWWQRSDRSIRPVSGASWSCSATTRCPTSATCSPKSPKTPRCSTGSTAGSIRERGRRRTSRAR